MYLTKNYISRCRSYNKKKLVSKFDIFEYPGCVFGQSAQKITLNLKL